MTQEQDEIYKRVDEAIANIPNNDEKERLANLLLLKETLEKERIKSDLAYAKIMVEKIMLGAIKIILVAVLLAVLGLIIVKSTQ